MSRKVTIEPFMAERRLIAEHEYMHVYEWEGTRPDWQLHATRVYSDGGVFRPRACEAGSWAWVATDVQGWMLTYQFGWVQANARIPEITNNMTEFLALLRALEAQEEGWRGIACSDSIVTLGRFAHGWRTKGIPSAWVRRMQAAKERLALQPDDYVPHKGHPTRQDIADGEGVRQKGGRAYPASVHQDNCDKLCGLALQIWSEHSGMKR